MILSMERFARREISIKYLILTSQISMATIESSKCSSCIILSRAAAVERQHPQLKSRSSVFKLWESLMETIHWL